MSQEHLPHCTHGAPLIEFGNRPEFGERLTPVAGAGRIVGKRPIRPIRPGAVGAVRGKRLAGPFPWAAFCAHRWKPAHAFGPLRAPALLRWACWVGWAAFWRKTTLAQMNDGLTAIT